MVVVLPAPLGPRKPKTSPCRTWKLTPASESFGALGYRLTRSVTSTATAPGGRRRDRHQQTRSVPGARIEEALAGPIVGSCAHLRCSPCRLSPTPRRTDGAPVAPDLTPVPSTGPPPNLTNRCGSATFGTGHVGPSPTLTRPARPAVRYGRRARSECMRGSGRWNPLRSLARSWGHFARRPRSTQIRTLAMVGAVFVGTVVWVAGAPSSASPTAASSGGSSPVQRLGTHPGRAGQHLDAGA